MKYYRSFYEKNTTNNTLMEGQNERQMEGHATKTTQIVATNITVRPMWKTRI